VSFNPELNKQRRDALCHLKSQLVDVPTKIACFRYNGKTEEECVPIPPPYTSRMFPNYPGPVYLTQRDSLQLPVDIGRVLMAGASTTSTCPEPATGRTAIPPIDPMRSSQYPTPFHDVSLCNLMGMGGDYLYIPFVNKVYVLGDPMGVPATIVLGVLIIWMMVVMGHNLQVGN
jgi:hypothetical protein